MSAYASLASLMNTIDDILSHPLHSFSLDKKELELLRMIIGFLLDFMESCNPGGVSEEEEEALASLIASEAHAAEDVIETHVVRHILSGSNGDHGQISSCSLHRVISDMNAVKEKAVEFRAGRKELEDVQLSNSSKSLSLGTARNDMVGFEDELIQLKDRLTGQQSNLQIIPIVGMGGIGKTTLATNVYQSLLVSESFDIRGWVTISQNYSLNRILSELGSCIVNKETKDTDEETEDDLLGVKLYQSLWGRRYLIVLDDMWSIEVWDKIKFIFPDNGNRSRVVITSRISNIAAHLTSSSLEMKLLDKDNCWKLFCREVFLGDGCPPELEEIGMNIVSKCKGLPLSIVVVGGLLRSSPRKREKWENFARDVRSSLMLGKDNCLDILSLSYYHLPAHLKPCFLYMGRFAEDQRIPLSNLIKRFVAGGFVRPNNGKSLEDMAEDNLKELVDKNLILVGRRRWTGRILYLKMHDVVREVCLRIAEKEKYFHAMRVLNVRQDIHGERQIVVHDIVPPLFDSLPGPSASLASKCRSTGGPLPFKSRFVRLYHGDTFATLDADLQQVHLRCLYYLPSSLYPEEIPSKLPSSLCLLWNLKTLIIRGFTRIHAPPEIWRMIQLRHLNIKELILPDPPQDGDDHVLPNLHTLSRVVDFSFTEEVCRRLPNIKKLGVTYSEECRKCYYHLNHLHKLQSLSCSIHENLKRGDLLESLAFPTCLMKLCLQNSPLIWADLNILSRSLPHLEILELGKGAIMGLEWDTEEGEFPNLKVLVVCCGDLVKWTVESFDVFPVLERLYLVNLKKLEEIPSVVRDMHTLQVLYVRCCSKSVAISSTEILLQQLDLGNQDLQVSLFVESKDEENSLRTKAVSKNFTHMNFQVYNFYDLVTYLGRNNMVLKDF